MKELRFSTNWNNKLLNKTFTTIRLSNRFKVGDEVNIYLKTELIDTGVILAVKQLNLLQIDEFTAYQDTGYSPEETREIFRTMYKNKNIHWDSHLLHVYLIQAKRFLKK